MASRVSKCVPISKELLVMLGIRISGRIGAQWICYVDRGRQVVHPYAPWAHIDPTPWTKPWQDKFAAGVAAAQALTPELRSYWQALGTNRLRPLPWFNAFLSSWMKDFVNLSTMRHLRNLKVSHG